MFQSSINRCFWNVFLPLRTAVHLLLYALVKALLLVVDCGYNAKKAWAVQMHCTDWVWRFELCLTPKLYAGYKKYNKQKHGILQHFLSKASCSSGVWCVDVSVVAQYCHRHTVHTPHSAPLVSNTFILCSLWKKNIFQCPSQLIKT